MKRVVITIKYLKRININFYALRQTVDVPWTIYSSSALFKIRSLFHFSLGVKTILTVPKNKKINIPLIMKLNPIADISPLFEDFLEANCKKTKISKSMKPSNPNS